MEKARAVRDQISRALEVASPLYGCAVHLTDAGFVVRVKAPKRVLATIPHEVDGVKVEHVPTL